MKRLSLATNPQDVIPRHWRGVYATSEDDLISLGFKNLSIIREYWEEKFSLSFSDAEKCRICSRLEHIETIMEVGAAKELKPYLVDARPIDWLKVNDDVIHYHQSSRNIPSMNGFFTDGVFLTGRVTEVDGDNLRIKLNQAAITLLGENCKEPEFYCERHSPFLINRWEYVYLKDHPDYAEAWAKAGMSWYGTSYAGEILNAPIR